MGMSVRIGAKGVADRWLKASWALKKQDQVTGRGWQRWPGARGAGGGFAGPYG